MQKSSRSSVQPDAILEWLNKEMGYRPLGPYSAQSYVSLPSADSIRLTFRGNMIPVWNFLVNHAMSEKTVANIRRNILIHGGNDQSSSRVVDGSKGDERNKGRRIGKEKAISGDGVDIASVGINRDVAFRGKVLAEKEVERLRHIFSRQRKELRARMLETSKEEAERKRILDERSNYRHKQVELEVYDRKCDEAARIFTEYYKRICCYINQVRDTSVDNSFRSRNVKDAVYSTIKGSKSSDDVILIETTVERDIRKACETLAEHMIKKINVMFPAYEGIGIHQNLELAVAKIGINLDSEIPSDVKCVILNCLKNPTQMLQAITAYTLRIKTLITKEIENVDVRADAKILRYKYENNIVIDASSPDVHINYQICGNEKIGINVPSRGSQNQLFEKQKAHVQKFIDTEDVLNKAAETRNHCQKLLSSLNGIGGTIKNVGSLKQFALDLFAKEREAAGMKASLNILMSEEQRLNKLCTEMKQAENLLKNKWRRVEEFDARRSELESVYTALLKANMDAMSLWNQLPLSAREHASTTIIPTCKIVKDICKSANDYIESEVSAFYRCPDNSLYMLPSTSQGLLESMGSSGNSGPEALAAAEKNAALLTARAGARDPSAIPSICRISAALQYPSGLDGSDPGLASVLRSLEFCLKLRGSEANVLEDLARAINLVRLRKDLLVSSHELLNHAVHARQEYARTTSYCLDLAAQQEKFIMEKWLPELKIKILDAQKGLGNFKYVKDLIVQWRDQPAFGVVDWVTLDGKNAMAYYNHVKQLFAAYNKLHA